MWKIHWIPNSQWCKMHFKMEDMLLLLLLMLLYMYIVTLVNMLIQAYRNLIYVHSICVACNDAIQRFSSIVHILLLHNQNNRTLVLCLPIVIGNRHISLYHCVLWKKHFSIFIVPHLRMATKKNNRNYDSHVNLAYPDFNLLFQMNEKNFLHKGFIQLMHIENGTNQMCFEKKKNKKTCLLTDAAKVLYKKWKEKKNLKNLQEKMKRWIDSTLVSPPIGDPICLYYMKWNARNFGIKKKKISKTMSDLDSLIWDFDRPQII